MAVIRIHDLRVSTIISVHSHERKKKQEVLINITIEYDSSIASKTDDIIDCQSSRGHYD